MKDIDNFDIVVPQMNAKEEIQKLIMLILK